MFTTRKMLVKEQNWPWKKSNIFKIGRLEKVNQFVYVNIISVNFTILVQCFLFLVFAL